MKLSQNSVALPLLPCRHAPNAPSGICLGLDALATSEYFILEIDRGCQLVVASRTAASYSSVARIRTAFDEVERFLEQVPRDGYALLGDTRCGPARNDPEFEEIIAKVRGKLLGGFSKGATLANSSVGKLQLRRYANVDGRRNLITSSEAEAFRYLELPTHPLALPS